MSFNKGTSPNVVITDLDSVFYQEYNKQSLNNYVTAESASIFNQATADNSAVIVETFGGIGYWPTRAEEGDVNSASPRVTNKGTYSVLEYANSVKIPVTFFEDQMHGSYDMMVRNFAETARVTRDRAAFKFWVDGFATNQTADAVYIFSASHTTISGATVDNLSSDAFSTTALNDALVALMTQKDQAGLVRGCIGRTILVPPALFKNACEVSDAQLRPNTANNEPNVFLTKFGLYAACSPHLSAASTGVSGADAYWYLLADNHSMTRYVRTPIETDLVDYKIAPNNTYVYKGRFREVLGCQDYVGLFGSTGA